MLSITLNGTFWLDLNLKNFVVAAMTTACVILLERLALDGVQSANFAILCTSTLAYSTAAG